MSGRTSAEVAGEIVELLTPLESAERLRVVRASLVLLGEEQSSVLAAKANKPSGEAFDASTDSNLPARARTWLKHHQISTEELEQVFHMSGADIAIIAADIPGKSVGEKAANAYLLTGLQKLLLSGGADFDDKSARALCETAGCYDSTNHTKYIAKNKDNYLSGNKDKGWELTSPGLKRVANLVREIAGTIQK
jgi:hypothetical protein